MVSLFVNHRPADRKNDGDDRQHRRHLELVLALYVQRPRQEGRGLRGHVRWLATGSFNPMTVAESRFCDLCVGPAGGTCNEANFYGHMILESFLMSLCHWSSPRPSAREQVAARAIVRRLSYSCANAALFISYSNPMPG
jgi:hypothetical protein